MHDPETGLYLLGHRYYDPATGRFLNRDPIGTDGGENIYNAFGGNPVNEIDPEGTDKIYVSLADSKGKPKHFMVGDIPDGKNVDTNIAVALGVKPLAEAYGVEKGNAIKALYMLREYGSKDPKYNPDAPNDWGKDLKGYPHSADKKLQTQRRLAANFNLGAVSAALGYSQLSALTGGEIAPLLKRHFHPQTEQDAIAYGWWYFYARYPVVATREHVKVPPGFKYGFVKEPSPR